VNLGNSLVVWFNPQLRHFTRIRKIGALVGAASHNPYKCTIIVTQVPCNGGPFRFELVEAWRHAGRESFRSNKLGPTDPAFEGYYED